MFTSISDEVSTALILILLQVVQHYTIGRYNKQLCRTSSLSGNAYISELVVQNHPRRIQEVFRMPLSTLQRLDRFFCDHTELQSSRYITTLEKIAMFMHVVGHKGSNRDIQERYQHSGSTVSHCFQKVLKACLYLHIKYVKLPSLPHRLATRISEDRKYTPYFDDCLGALDGTHIPMHILEHECRPYRNRKGWLLQNVLAACDFDIRFRFILPGWEGSAHDSRILKDAMDGKGFVVPEGKYWLVDAGYSNSNYLLTPYKSVRYHLKEQHLAQQRPRNPKELFNLRHSSLRNVIENIFGVSKKRFPCLKTAMEFSKETQVDIVYAVTALHNFIVMHPSQDEEDIYDGEDSEDEESEDVNGNQNEDETSTLLSDALLMNQKRDAIAQAMWMDYQQYLSLV